MMTTLTVLATLVAVPFLFGSFWPSPWGGHGPAFCARLGAGAALRIGAARRATGRVGMKVPAVRTVCSVRNTPDKFAPRHVPVAQHILDCVAAWHTAIRVLGSAGRTRPPTPAPQLAKETS
jgi:hypothetical protein